MVRGCITYHGVGPLVFMAENMNSAKYIEVLDTNLLPVIARYFVGERWYFQDDNAAINTPTETEHWKRRNEFHRNSDHNRAQI